MYSELNTINPSDFKETSSKEHLEIAYKMAQHLLDMGPVHQNEALKTIFQVVKESREKRIELLNSELAQLTKTYQEAFGTPTP